MAERQQHLGFKSARAKGPSSWLRLCLDCRDVSWVLWWPKRTQSHPFLVKKQQQRTTTLASSLQNSKMQYRKRNRLRNPPVQYSTCIYYRIAGYFRGVLIFIIFVVNPGVTKFSTHEIFHPRNFPPLQLCQQVLTFGPGDVFL